jgi:hypothetical protein
MKSEVKSELVKVEPAKVDAAAKAAAEAKAAEERNKVVKSFTVTFTPRITRDGELLLYLHKLEENPEARDKFWNNVVEHMHNLMPPVVPPATKNY